MTDRRQQRGQAVQGPPESPAIRFIDPQPLGGAAAGVTDPPGHGEEKQQRQQNDAQQDGPPLPPAQRGRHPPAPGTGGSERPHESPVWDGRDPETLSFLTPALGRDIFHQPGALQGPVTPGGWQGPPEPWNTLPPPPSPALSYPRHPSGPAHANPSAATFPSRPPQGLSGGRKGDSSHPPGPMGTHK